MYKRFKVWARNYEQFEIVMKKARELGFEIDSELTDKEFWKRWMGFGSYSIGMFFFIGASPCQIGYTEQLGTYKNHSFMELSIVDFLKVTRKVGFEE